MLSIPSQNDKFPPPDRPGVLEKTDSRDRNPTYF